MHILCSCTRQYECDMFLMAFRVHCRSDTSSETVPGQIFSSFNFCGLGFIREYNQNLYTAKISTYIRYLLNFLRCSIFLPDQKICLHWLSLHHHLMEGGSGFPLQNHFLLRGSFRHLLSPDQIKCPFDVT